MPRGSSAKREKDYEELQDKFNKSGRYKGREKEVASRIVNKQRSRYGEIKEEKSEQKRGRSPDRDLPIKDYQHLTVGEVKRKLGNKSSAQLEQIKRYEKSHKNRKTLLQELDRRTS